MKVLMPVYGVINLSLTFLASPAMGTLRKLIGRMKRDGERSPSVLWARGNANGAAPCSVGYNGLLPHLPGNLWAG